MPQTPKTETPPLNLGHHPDDKWKQAAMIQQVTEKLGITWDQQP